jgi:hypothetical protein
MTAEKLYPESPINQATMSSAKADATVEGLGTDESHRFEHTGSSGSGPRLTADQVWHTLEKSSFAVLSYRTPSGDPRSSGVVYKTLDRKLYVAVAPDSWKARHIGASGRIAVTVPVRRGGLLSLIFPIPPATVSFHGKASVHATDSTGAASVLGQLRSLLPPERRSTAVLIEILAEDAFVTYGVGVSLKDMRSPKTARARVSVFTEA